MENTLNIQLKVTDKQMVQLLEGKVDSLPDEKFLKHLGSFKRHLLAKIYFMKNSIMIHHQNQPDF